MLAPSDTRSPQTRARYLWQTDPALAASLIVAAVSAALIAGAWFFELVVRLAPCPLCLEQRVPHYIAIPLAIVVALAAWRKAPRGVLIVGLLALAGLMLWSTGLGVYHAGIEWKWWAGPQGCSGAAELGPATDFLKRLQNFNPTRCDAAAWRFLGVSLAGYNALASLGLAAVALLGAKAAAR